ncbi:MAG TPA: class F sortase [Marmoricola sp.]|nr:class F sortase [Marmoricola sp.]
MLRTRSGLRVLVAAVVVAASAGIASVVTSESAQAAAPTSCTSTRGAFVPTQARISHIGRVQVIVVGKNSDGSMGTPPLTNAGKRQLAWFRGGSKPGSGRGGVATDAHSWPDGSALGNALYAKVFKGDTVILSDASNRHRTCYRVTSRQQFNRSAVPMNRVVRGNGKGQILSIVVCSGQRLGPGNWTQRTVWTAVAIAPPKPKSTPSPKPSPSPAPSSGGLLGGLLGGL